MLLDICLLGDWDVQYLPFLSRLLKYFPSKSWIRNLRYMINTLDFLCAFRVLQSVRMKCSTFSEENPYRQLLSPFYRRSASALLKKSLISCVLWSYMKPYFVSTCFIHVFMEKVFQKPHKWLDILFVCTIWYVQKYGLRSVCVVLVNNLVFMSTISFSCFLYFFSVNIVQMKLDYVSLSSEYFRANSECLYA